MWGVGQMTPQEKNRWSKWLVIRELIQISCWFSMNKLSCDSTEYRWQPVWTTNYSGSWTRYMLSNFMCNLAWSLRIYILSTGIGWGEGMDPCLIWSSKYLSLIPSVQSPGFLDSVPSAINICDRLAMKESNFLFNHLKFTGTAIASLQLPEKHQYSNLNIHSPCLSPYLIWSYVT